MRRSFLGGNNNSNKKDDDDEKYDLDSEKSLLVSKTTKRKRKNTIKSIPVPETPPRLPRGMSVLLVSFSAPTAKDARGGKGEQQQVFVFDGKSEVCAQRNGEVRPRERRENKSDLEEEEEEERGERRRRRVG